MAVTSTTQHAGVKSSDPADTWIMLPRRDRCDKDLQVGMNGQRTCETPVHRKHNTWMLARGFSDTSVLELALCEKRCQTRCIDEMLRAEDLDYLNVDC